MKSETIPYIHGLMCGLKKKHISESVESQYNMVDTQTRISDYYPTGTNESNKNEKCIQVPQEWH